MVASLLGDLVSDLFVGVGLDDDHVAEDDVQREVPFRLTATTVDVIDRQPGSIAGRSPSGEYPSPMFRKERAIR